MKNSIVTSICIFLLLPTYAHSDIRYFEHKVDSCFTFSNSGGCFNITGIISQSDANYLESIASDLIENNKMIPIVHLNSGGGDVKAAIQIGTLLRKLRANAVVAPKHTCLSACVFVLAGATQRNTFGIIGIHRPYILETGNINYNNFSLIHKNIKLTAKSYLEDMNIPPSLFEAMTVIPSEEIKILTKNELTKYGLVAMDPVEEDYFDTMRAGKLQLSKVEYLKRKKLIKSVCQSYFDMNKFHEYADCQNKILQN